VATVAAAGRATAEALAIAVAVDRTCLHGQQVLHRTLSKEINNIGVKTVELVAQREDASRVQPLNLVGSEGCGTEIGYS